VSELNLRTCTLTGVDAWTDFGRMESLSRRFRFVEWGVLYSPGRQGQDNRYPSMGESSRWMDLRTKRACKLAMHVCGVGVSEVIGASAAWLEMWLTGFGRVQLNLRGDRFAAHDIASAVRKIRAGNPDRRVIIQLNSVNRELCEELDGMTGLEMLWDASGGRGLLAKSWAKWGDPAHSRVAQCPWGYAGGLGPQNVVEELPKIAEAAGGREFWIDMEQSLRDGEDMFDLDRAEAVLEMVNAARLAC